MSDLSTFRVVRSPQSRGVAAAAVYRPVDPGAAALPMVEALYTPPTSKTADNHSPAHLAADYVADSKRFVNPDAPATLPVQAQRAIADGLRALDGYLVAAGNRPAPGDLDARVRELSGTVAGAGDAAALVGSEAWFAVKSSLVQSLAATMILARRPDPAHQATAAALTRRLLVAGLVEWWADETEAPGADAIYRALHDRTLVLPTPPTRSAPVDALVRRPGFADLYVVRSEWSCYVPGEIAHIDNVMRGEKRERVHMRLDETETTQTTDVFTDTTEERDTQSTDRFTLDAEADSVTNLKLAIAASVDTSGQYGPTHVNSHVGGGFDYSDDESRKLATNQAHEIIAKAVSKVEKTVRNVQTTRTLNRIRERNTHAYDATDSPDHIRGVYRWVDKIERVQLFRYRHRYLLEFQVPEPAAWYVWSRRVPAAGATAITPFTVDGTASGRPLAVTDVDESTYTAIAARYGVANLVVPPARQRVVETSFTLESDPPDYAGAGDHDINLHAAPAITKSMDLAVPDGYHTLRVDVSAVATPAMARWGDSEIPGGHTQSFVNDSRYAWVWGYHSRRVDVTIGNTVVRLFDTHQPTVQEATRSVDAWLSQANSGTVALPPITGKVTIAAASVGTYRATVSASVLCAVNDDHRDQWAADTYTKIRAAYDAARQAEADNAVSMFAPTDALGASDSPAQNAVTVHEELKRQIVELLLGEPFRGYGAVVYDADASVAPHLDPAALRAAAPYVQMMEQAFEWENITYVCYPYFWADSSRWAELAGRRSADPDFQAFLRSGSARVVVPARPGFEGVVNAYLDYGLIWGGGPAPTPGDPDYLSIADEIRAMQQAPDDGEPGESWEVRLPTTLVWLDHDSDIPKVNPARRLAAPPDPICPAPAPTT